MTDRSSVLSGVLSTWQLLIGVFISLTKAQRYRGGPSHPKICLLELGHVPAS